MDSIVNLGRVFTSNEHISFVLDSASARFFSEWQSTKDEDFKAMAEILQDIKVRILSLDKKPIAAEGEDYPFKRVVKP